MKTSRLAHKQIMSFFIIIGMLLVSSTITFTSFEAKCILQIDGGSIPFTIQWDVQVDFNEPGGAKTYTIFGEATDANDGPPPDSYDVPKPPNPTPPYISAWFDDDMSIPYNFLLKDYRLYPSIYKKWNLSVQWVPLDSVTPTTLTISWDINEVDDCEYTNVELYNDSDGLLKDMLTESSYTYTASAMISQDFYIVCYVVNYPPDRPERPTGPIEVKVGTECTWSSKTTDPNGDQIYYWFDWDDGTNSGWIGPYDSDQEANAKHTYEKKGDVNIIVKARDEYDAESGWSPPLTVTIPRNKVLTKTFFIDLFEQYLNMLPILNLLLHVFGQ